MRTAIFSALLAALIPFSTALSEPSERLISTTGQATVYATPDKVILFLGVEMFNRALDQSKDDNDQASANLLKSLTSLGIDDKDIQASEMSVDIVYNDYNEPVKGVQGYKTIRTYSVTLHNLKQFADLIDTSLKNGANRLQGFRYDTTELRTFRDQARALAIRAAKEKAVALAKELDCKPGRPMTITETGSDYYSPMNSNAFAVGGAFGGGGMNGVATQTMPTGQIPITANVNVSFELQDLP